MSMFESLLLNALLQQNQQPPAFGSKTEAEAALSAFLEAERNPIETGDPVERNEMGRRIYQIPGENQAAKCVEKIPAYVDGNGNYCDMRIAVALAKDVIRHYDVDSRCYRVVGTNTVNVYDFKKKPR